MDIVVRGCTMKNVSRPVWILLNNRFEPDDLGSSVELQEMPCIGTMENIIISDIIMTDEEEMKNTHYRFENDVMGSPRFGGMRIDACAGHPIESLVMKNIIYTAVGGVKKTEIPAEYPAVIDRLEDRESPSAENYYPDWSRTVFLDCRNVKNLLLEDLILRKRYPDERDGVIIEGCETLKSGIYEM